jgi:hypothetical protein
MGRSVDEVAESLVNRDDHCGREIRMANFRAQMRLQEAVGDVVGQRDGRRKQ